ncbi:MAG: MFS transporter [Actinobacteria bacterium]|nr:MFS transporter [Actinomycetota bacterium]
MAPPDGAAGNGAKLVAAMTLTKTGDRVVDAKTVLAWLFATLGVPAFLTGLLVPIRESGSLLPQAALVPLVRRRPRRKVVWIAGAAGQAVAVLVMAVVAVTSRGAAAGWAVLAALAGFALSRSLASIASKDVLGRTIPKGRRGRISGAATVMSGMVAIAGGAAIGLLGDGAGPATFAWLLVGGAAMWLLALLVYVTVREPVGDHAPDADASEIVRSLALLRDDPPFRRFVVARTLLLVSALAPPFVVTLASREAGTAIAGLGPFVIAQGLASMLGGRAWGRLADRSSRATMVWSAGLAGVVVLAFLAALRIGPVADAAVTYPLVYFVLALLHTGSRLGRKTYVVDLAEGDRRTRYVAVSNTAMGVLLLVTGAVSAGLAGLGIELALAFLAVLGLAAVPVARSLPDVSARA